MTNDRASRIADNIFRFIAEAILVEAKDPRLARVTITGVDISPDMKKALVYFSLMDAIEENATVLPPANEDEYARYVNDRDSKAVKEAIKAFANAEGFLKREILKRLKIKRVPSLTFKYDPSFKRGHRIGEILKKVNTDESTKE